ncbi:type VI secretion system Vgr family protein [Motilimonas pumila]|uniref:Type VI secretion system tip protein VgrG n=1 Tax=Motilimonas pumila TaxID=2303987 RepID=A0A418YD90_9GAMM|nr:type VI secretion system tip protein VgrG [Motilimonas pumila]RJG42492.1 type VI secretion system tip protein VgrG [Motilimonas pumila]
MADQTGLQFTLTCEDLDPETFAVTNFTGNEQLSTPFEFECQLVSEQSGITAQQVVDKTAQLTLWQDGEVLRHIHGIVSAFTQADIGHHHTAYKLILSPAAKRLCLRHNSRIFQQLNAAEIISILLQEMGINDYAFSIKTPPATREYCVQYRESDLDFINRLAAEEGLFYFFFHQNNKHEMVFCDDAQSLVSLSQPVQYNAKVGGYAKTHFISSLTLNSQVTPAKVALQDYSFKKPNYRFMQNQVGVELDFQRQTYEHFDFPGRYKDDGTGAKFSNVRQQYLNRDSITAKIQSNFPSLFAGLKFDLIDHNNDANNRDWQCLKVTHSGEQPQALQEYGDQGMTRYHNHAIVMPAHRQWKADITAKPRVDGPQIATVTGPKGEEIYCDEHGRVKIQFPWDRYSDNDENASCWVRVAQGWAGAQYGAMAIPRIGHEVIVSFLEGDPDQPIITGRTYHATHKPPYALPEHKTRTVLRSQSHKAEGYNELRFEDEVGQEEIYLHAQKDQNSLVENDQARHIKQDAHHQTDRHDYQLINGQQHTSVDQNHHLHTLDEHTDVVDQNRHEKVATAQLVKAGTEIHHQAGVKIVLEAGSELTLKAGGSFIKIDGGGVHLSGPAINLNAGGSAGSGKGYGGQPPELPQGVEQAVAFTNELPPLTPAQLTTLSAKVPFCEECEPCKDGSCAV